MKYEPSNGLPPRGVPASTLALALAAMNLGLLAVAAEPAPAFPRDLLDHIRRNAPPGTGDCIVEKVQARWRNGAALYDEANKPRAIRGQTDVVNYAIRTVRDQCAPRL